MIPSYVMGVAHVSIIYAERKLQPQANFFFSSIFFSIEMFAEEAR